MKISISTFLQNQYLDFFKKSTAIVLYQDIIIQHRPNCGQSVGKQIGWCVGQQNILNFHILLKKKLQKIRKSFNGDRTHFHALHTEKKTDFSPTTPL